MKLFLVRHGETDVNRILGHGVSGPMHNEPVTFSPGQDTNIPLNIYGRAQAKEACANTPDDITIIYCSPLLRAKETAEIIADGKKLDRTLIKTTDKLAEYHQGSLEGLSSEKKKK
jgi:broad specificity phosphatase PhoE